MSRFFRNTRWNLLATQRLPRYLLYALGEIVLVVIGILIALQLNNWNTEHKAGILETGLLKEMHQNLERDLSDCRYNIKTNEQLHHGSVAVLRHLEERIPFHDSLRLHYGRLWGGTVQNMNTSAFDNLKSIGFDLIQNDSLRRSITVLYSERFAYVRRLETGFDNQIQLNEMLPQVNAKIVIVDMWKSGYPIDVGTLMDDDAFKGLLRTNVFVRAFMTNQYRLLEQQILSLIAQIDAELKGRQQ